MGIIVMPERYRVTVPRNRSCHEMIRARKYKWVNPLIAEPHFPLAEQGGEEENDILLLRPETPVTSEEVREETDRQKCSAVSIRPLLMLNEQLRDSHRKLQVVTLDHGWRDPKDDKIVVLCVWGESSHRYLDLRTLEGVWYPASGYAFAVTPLVPHRG